ncbi:MAG: arsenate reductase (glutaredoxin) [Alphaproteobacteria bacterium]|nr:arsenate reductase (glutaredoxin) [Alphaproteobacteria bacterium]
MGVRIYHNPRCSKSRQTLALLRANGVEPEIIEYLKTPPSAKVLGDILKLLGLEPREAMRAKEAAYRELGVDDVKLTRADLIRLMVENPVLIERPIVIANGKAAIGRPPEAVLTVL